MKLSIIYFPINIPLIVTILIRSQIYISNRSLIPLSLSLSRPHLVSIVSPVLTHCTGTDLGNQCIILVKYNVKHRCRKLWLKQSSKNLRWTKQLTSLFFLVGCPLFSFLRFWCVSVLCLVSGTRVKRDVGSKSREWREWRERGDWLRLRQREREGRGQSVCHRSQSRPMMISSTRSRGGNSRHHWSPGSTWSAQWCDSWGHTFVWN